MSTFDLGALAGGGLSALGGLLGGQAPGRAGRQARDYYNNQTGWGMDRLLGVLFGQSGLDARNGLRPGGLIDTSGATLGTKTFGAGGAFGGLGAANTQLQNRYGAITNQLSGALNRQQTRANSLEGMARQWGVGAERLIDEQTAQGLSGANRTAIGYNAARGLGNSSLASNQLSENAMDFARQAAEQKVGIRGQQLDRQTAARQYATDLMGKNAATIADTRQGQATNIAGLKRSDISTLLSLMSGGVMNPWLGQGTSQFYPGTSGAGSALASVGNSLSAYAGSMSQSRQLQDLMKLLRPQGGGENFGFSG